MTLEIRRDVPLPGDCDRYEELIEAFGKMQPGYSVIFTGAHSYIHALAAECGIRIRVRATNGLVALRGLKEYRIWRIK
jgi:hypothetical protein